MPVLIGFVLFLLAVPVLALVWGARVTDLLEVWAQFRAGFQIGETTISPTDFLTFVLIFGGGYLLTQFVKRQLKPRSCRARGWIWAGRTPSPPVSAISASSCRR